MASEGTGEDLEKSLENINRQLLENQSFLYDENRKLQDNVNRLSKNLEELRKCSADPEIMERLKSEKTHLVALNNALKRKIKSLKAPPPDLDREELAAQEREKRELAKSVDELDIILKRISSRPENFEISVPQESTFKEVCEVLSKRLDEEQKRSDEAFETIRRLRDDDEKLILKDKITDLKHLITDLEVENSKLRFEAEQSSDDIVRYKRELSETVDEAKSAKKEKYRLEEEVGHLKQIITDLENEKIKLKKDMIEELTEANRVKRVSADTEIALQHISEAYENKRKEVARYQKQLDEANAVIKAFREQLESPNKSNY